MIYYFSALTPTPPNPVQQKKVRTRKGYMVRLHKLTEADIWKAERGYDLPAIMEKYKGTVRNLDKTEIGKLRIMKSYPIFTQSWFYSYTRERSFQALARSALQNSHQESACRVSAAFAVQCCCYQQTFPCKGELSKCGSKEFRQHKT